MAEKEIELPAVVVGGKKDKEPVHFILSKNECKALSDFLDRCYWMISEEETKKRHTDENDMEDDLLA